MAGNEDKELKNIPGLTDEEKAAASETGDVESSTAEAQQLTSGKSEKELQKKRSGETMSGPKTLRITLKLSPLLASMPWRLAC